MVNKNKQIMIDAFANTYQEANVDDITKYVEFVFNKTVDSTNEYTEKHHCVPQSICPALAKNKANIFNLLYVDHITAHFLLWKAIGEHDDGESKKALSAVCWVNQYRQMYHPKAWVKYLNDVVNGRRFEINFESAYAQRYGDEIVNEEDTSIKYACDMTSFLSNVDLITNEYLDPVELPDIELPYRYRPYPFQGEIIDEFFAMLEGESTRKRFALELHRRAGKDVTFWQLVVAAACTTVGDYAYMLPSHTQAKKVIWNGTVNDEMGNPCKFFDFIPPTLNPNPKVSENRVELSNGSSIYVIGSDNYDGLVGMNLKGVVFSEWSLCNPLAYDYLAPMLRRNAKIDPLSGWALFCWTPRGRNHAYKTRQLAMMEKNKNLWYFMSKTIDHTTDANGNRLISDQDIQEELDSGADPDKIKQEYYLDYDAAVKGIIYGKQMEIARNENRIRHVGIDPKTPVLTFWDIGVNDHTSIWFVQPNGEELNLINYYENTDEGVQHYVKYMKDFAQKHGIKYGTVYLPHDGKNKEWIAGERRHTVVANMGFDTFVIPRTQDLETAITQTKGIFKRFVFDESRCFQGITCLDNYRRKINTEGTEGSPHHDWSSNGADALRQIGQYYADKFVSKQHDQDHWMREQQQMNYEDGLYGNSDFIDDYGDLYD